MGLALQEPQELLCNLSRFSVTEEHPDLRAGVVPVQIVPHFGEGVMKIISFGYE